MENLASWTDGLLLLRAVTAVPAPKCLAILTCCRQPSGSVTDHGIMGRVYPSKGPYSEKGFLTVLELCGKSLLVNSC